MAESIYPPSIGFIGLGAMGYPMCSQLRQKLPVTTPLYIFDVNAAALTRFTIEHANSGPITVCSSAREVGEAADTIISIVPEGTHVEAVYLSASGLLRVSNLAGKTLIDSSTIGVSTSTSVSSFIPAGTRFLDAPVSGGPMGAEKGTLTFMVGAAEDAFFTARLRPLLMLMGNNIFACGGPGCGLAAKLCNNYLSGLIAVATSESMNLGMRSGLDPAVLHAIFKTSTAQNWVSDSCNPVPGVCPEAPPSRGYEGGFRVEFMRKDFQLAVEAAEQVSARLELGEAGLRVYTAASRDERFRGRDSRVVYKWLGGRDPTVAEGGKEAEM